MWGSLCLCLVVVVCGCLSCGFGALVFHVDCLFAVIDCCVCGLLGIDGG